MKKIPGTLYQIDIGRAKANRLKLKISYRNEIVIERTGLIEEEIIDIIQDLFEERDLSIPQNRIDWIVKEELKNLSTNQGVSFAENTVSEMLDEFGEAPAEEMKKIILTGLSNAGKTCIYERIFESKNPWELMHSAQTKGISYKEYKVGNVLKPIIWDLGGQQQYLDEYHGPLRKSIYQKASILLFVLDISDTERFEDAVKEFQWAADQIQSFNQDVELNIFLHKIDLIHDKAEIIEYLKRLFSKNISKKISFHPTSIFNESLFKAWSEIILQMAPKSKYINSILKQLKNHEGVSNVMVIEKSTGLACSSTLEESDEDIVIGMFSLLMVTIEKFRVKMQFDTFKELRLKSENNYILMIDVTADLFLVIILDTDTELKTNLIEDIYNKGKVITQQISKVWME